VGRQARRSWEAARLRYLHVEKHMPGDDTVCQLLLIGCKQERSKACRSQKVPRCFCVLISA
jgi:hypothetical protein